MDWIARCCVRPDLYRAYAPFWPFRAIWCGNCREACLVNGRVLGWVWEWLIVPFFWWRGAFPVRVVEDRGDEREGPV